MRYVSGEEILVLHARIVDATGGAHGLRDPHLVASLVEKPRMKFGRRELCKGLFKKAAAYLEAIATYHVFIDGNKRTALAVTARFLFLNGRMLTATNREAEQFVLAVARKKHNLEHIAAWVKQHSSVI